MEPVGMTKASATNSLSNSTRTTTKTSVSKISRVRSRGCSASFFFASAEVGRVAVTADIASHKVRKTIARRKTRSKSETHCIFQLGSFIRHALEKLPQEANPRPVDRLKNPLRATDGHVSDPARLMQQKRLPQ